MTQYQGVDNAFNFTVWDLLKRISFAYNQFFYPSRYEPYTLYHFPFVRWCYGFILLVLLLAGCIWIYRAWKKRETDKIVELSILFLLCPLAINSYFLLVDVNTAYIYSLMTFSQIGTYFLLLEVIKIFCYSKTHLTDFGIVLLTFLIVFFAYRANVSYTKISIVHTQSEAYLNRLILRIEDMPFYTQDKPIAFIGANKKSENPQIPYWFNSTNLDLPYTFDSYNNSYNWRIFMEMWCDFNYIAVTQEQEELLANSDEVKSMPCYPDAGSIKLIDNSIVVKFANNSEES